MKIQIIQLDEHDDIISARDKMAWCKTARILLVWPKEGKVLTRELDLVLLLRLSNSLGSQLGLVSRDRQVKANASDTVIPVFPSVAKAQRSYWRHSRNRTSLEYHLQLPQELRNIFIRNRQIEPGGIISLSVRIGFFSLGILAMIALLAAFIPSAIINVTPNTMKQQIVFQVSAGESTLAPNLNGSLPLKKITVDVAGADSLQTSGRIQVPLSEATGYVVFDNLTDQPVEIPVGTYVRAGAQDIIRFITTRPGRVLAGIGNSTTLPIKAVLPGEDGNVPARSIDAIDGSLGLSLSVTNISAMIGGSSEPGAAVSEGDFATLENRLKKTLMQTAKDHISALIQPQDQMIINTLVQVSTLEESHFPDVGQPADRLTLTLHAEFSVDYIAGTDLHSLALTLLDANKPGGYLSLNDDIKLTPIDEPSIDANKSVQWKYQAERTLQEGIDTEKAVAMIPGMLPQDAARQLAARLKLEKEPVIAIFPAWWPRVPLLPLRIDLVASKGQ